MMLPAIEKRYKGRYNIYRAFKDTADKYPALTAFKASGGLGKIYTFREVEQLVGRISRYLRLDSLEDYKEIGLISENRPEWGMAYLAILASGKTVVPIDSNLKEKEIAYIFDHWHPIQLSTALDPMDRIQLLLFPQLFLQPL